MLWTTLAGTTQLSFRAAANAAANCGSVSATGAFLGLAMFFQGPSSTHALLALDMATSKSRGSLAKRVLCGAQTIVTSAV